MDFPSFIIPNQKDNAASFLNLNMQYCRKNKKDVSKTDIIAPSIPASLQAKDLCGTDIADDEVFSAIRSEASVIENINAEHVSFDRCVFSGCTFRNVSLQRLDISDSRFVNCNLSNVDFGKALIHRTVFEGCNLTGIDFRESAFRNTVFDNCLTRYSFFRSSDLDRSAFHSCRMEQADFQQVKLARVSFAECDMTQVRLSGTKLKEVDLSTCCIDGLGVTIEDLPGVIVSPAQAVDLAKLTGLIVKM